MFDGRDTIVIDDKIAYEDLLPVRWGPAPSPPSDVQAAHYAERNLRVLQACDALEEHGQLDKKRADDDSPHSADLMRLDFKLNTLLDVIVQPLHLPAEVVAGADAGFTRVRFLALGETVADHIEKLVFRRHRR